MYTSLEITLKEDLLKNLKSGASLAAHIAHIVEKGYFKNEEEAIASVMDHENKDTLMGYLCFFERYEDAQVVKDIFDKMLLTNYEW